MSKRKTDINPLWAERVKIIIKREKTTQMQLAKDINLVPQSVNRICMGRNALTEETARNIIACFPESEYRLEWLLGFDDYMTKSDFWRDGVKTEKATQNAIQAILSNAFVEISRFEKSNVQVIEDIPIEDYELIEAQIRDFARSMAWNYLHQEQSNFWRREKRIDERIMEEEAEDFYHG